MIVLDTHALIWWVNGDQKLSSPARKAIAKELAADSGQILVSAISAWEIAMLIAKDRLILTMDLNDWLATVESIEGVMIVALSTEVAVQSVRLPGSFHADPADRIIVALARHFSAPLISADARIKTYPHVKTIW